MPLAISRLVDYCFPCFPVRQYHDLVVVQNSRKDPSKDPNKLMVSSDRWRCRSEANFIYRKLHVCSPLISCCGSVHDRILRMTLPVVSDSVEVTDADYGINRV